MRTLYDDNAVTVILTDDGDIVLSRTDRYMRNEKAKVPAFVHQKVVLMNINKETI